MTNREKSRTEPNLDLDDLEEGSKNIYKKHWPKEEAEDSNLQGILDHPSYKELEQKLTEAEAKANEYWNAQLSAKAEAENMRRRTDREIGNAHRYALEKIANDLLPVVDSLERALVSEIHDNEYAKKIHEGIELTMSLFLKTLEKHGITQVDPLGQPFNPELHQAISTQPSEEQTNTVLEVLQKGYLLNDRLIRPALVVVAA